MSHPLWALVFSFIVLVVFMLTYHRMRRRD